MFWDDESLNASVVMRGDFIRFSPDDPVSSFLGKLRSAHQTWGVVCDSNGNYLGIASRKNLLKPKMDAGKVKLSSVLMKAPLLEEDTPLHRVAELMYTSDSRMLVVAKNQKPLGVVRSLDVVTQFIQFKPLRDLRVSDVATRSPVTIPSNATMAQTIQLMRDKNVGRVPAVNEKGELVGIVSFRDLVDHYLLFPTSRRKGETFVGAFDPTKLDSFKMPIESALSEHLVSVSLNDSLEKTIQLMGESHLADVVVLDGRKLAGIVTIRDLLECFLRLKREERNIQWSGLPPLDEIDSAKVQKTVDGTYDKLKKSFPKISYLAIHVRSIHQQSGKRQFEVNARLAAPKALVVSSATEWNLISAIQESMNALEKESRKKSRELKWWLPW